MTDATPNPVLVVTADALIAAHIVNDLRKLRRVAVSVDEFATALEMIRTIDFGFIVVDVAAHEDWRTCQRITAMTHSSVIVVTDFLAADRRYRTRAFDWGIAAYISKPCTRRRLKQAIRRIESGETAIELVNATGLVDTD